MPLPDSKIHWVVDSEADVRAAVGRRALRATGLQQRLVAGKPERPARPPVIRSLGWAAPPV